MSMIEIKTTTSPRLYGLLAEYKSPEALIEAAQKTYARGYRRIDAYSPFPVEGLAEAIGFHSNRMPLIVLIGGLLGGTGAFFMMWFSAVLNYPINVGGKPLVELAGVRADHVRADDPGGARSRRSSACSA